jgi:hypothetical protein
MQMTTFAGRGIWLAALVVLACAGGLGGTLC